MKKQFYANVLCLLLFSLTINTTYSQTFEPVVPDSISTVVYVLRDPAMLGGAVPWPIYCLNRTLYGENVTKNSIQKEHLLANLKQKHYCQLNLIAGMDYIINVLDNGHYILYNGKPGSVALLTIKGVKSYIYCYSGEIFSMSNSESDIDPNADIITDGNKLIGDPASCNDLLIKMAGYKQNEMKK